MAEIDAGRANAIVVFKLDRMTRSLRELFTLLERSQLSRHGYLQPQGNLATNRADTLFTKTAPRDDEESG